MKVKRKYQELFENRTEEELIYVWAEDLDGYILYEYCSDGTQQIYKMTPVELFRDYKMVHIVLPI